MNAVFTHDELDQAFGRPAARVAEITEGLNPKQKKAVLTTKGPVRIMAGAGTGKTTVVIRRIANIINSGLARPDQVLAVTFTKKAAGEMRARLGAMLGDNVARLAHVGNFHSVSSQILRRHSHLLGLPQKFVVLDEYGQREVIADLALKLGHIGSKKDRSSVMRYLSQIASWKEDGHDAEAVLAAEDIQTVTTGIEKQDHDFLITAAEIFEAYQAELKHHRWCDFADLVLHTVRLFRTFPEVRDEEAGKYRYIMVDEFQDTSPVQNEWVAWMARDHKNICVVGDTDQSIYEWRNARPDIMLNFDKMWPGTQTITVDTNYRSTQQILDVANAGVAPLRQKDKLDKRLSSGLSGICPSELVRAYGTGSDEADAIADEIDARIISGTTPSEMAILCRSAMVISAVERSLRSRGIKYAVAGAMKFTDREEVKDALAWLTLAVNPMDYFAFSRVSNKPARSMGPSKITALKKQMRAEGQTIADAALTISSRHQPKTASHKSWKAMSEMMKVVEAIAQNSDSAGAMLEDILDEVGYLDWRRSKEGDPQKEQRLEHIEQLIEEAYGYESALEFLETLALQAGGDAAWGQDSVIVSTVHASKGLEFDIVFCPAMEEGVFPNARSLKSAYGKDEERRLAHVAWTRARNELHVSYAGYRMGGASTGQPSRYLAEAGFFGAPKPSRETGRRKLRRAF